MRFDLINYLKSFIGSRYQWGSEGPYNSGFDCSGLVLEGLRSIGMWGIMDSNAQGIFDHFNQKVGCPVFVSKPDLGDLVFFGKDLKNITHIGIMINNYQFIEAGGGSKNTVDVGMVRIRPLTWRRDHVGSITIFKD